jgi:hypothetical protein
MAKGMIDAEAFTEGCIESNAYFDARIWIVDVPQCTETS